MLHKIYGWGRVGWGGMITFFGLELIADATQDLRLGSGRVGWGGMITFFGLAHMVDATQDLRLGSGGVGWDDKHLHIERKITSLVHSHPPSHYIRTHVFLPTNRCGPSVLSVVVFQCNG